MPCQCTNTFWGERRVKELHKQVFTDIFTDDILFHKHWVPQVINVQNSADLKKTSVAQDDASTLTQSKADAQWKRGALSCKIRQTVFEFQACDTNIPRFSGSLPDSEGVNQKFKVLSSLRRKLVKFITASIFKTVTPCGWKTPYESCFHTLLRKMRTILLSDCLKFWTNQVFVSKRHHAGRTLLK